MKQKRMRKGVGKSVLLSTVLGLIKSGFAQADAAIQKQKPNVLIIYADDLGYGELSCYGGEKVPTPNCDQFAREGLRFTDAYTAAAVCTPARYGLLTSRYPWRTWKKEGVVGNTPSMFEWGVFILPKLFKSAGYTTAAIGKWHIGFGERDAKDLEWNEDLPKGPVDCVGFDYFFGNPVSRRAVRRPPISRKMPGRSLSAGFAVIFGKTGNVPFFLSTICWF